MKIASWNINGIRACHKKGLLDWVNNHKFDIICFQETKAQEDQVPKDIIEHPDYKGFYVSAVKKGYSGVAILVHKRVKKFEILKGLGKKKFDDEGRTIAIKTPNFTLFNCYFPNGGREHDRVPYKMDYCKFLAKYIEEISGNIIVTGDYNTAHHEIDLANPKSNTKTSGFLPIERKWMDDFVEKGYIDAFRTKYPKKAGEYTWWTYRGDCRARNIGWRIDYFFTNKSFGKKIKDCYHMPEVMGSDHCPVVLEL